MADISGFLSKTPANVFSYSQYHGGMRPRLRIRCPNALTIQERWKEVRLEFAGNK